MNKTSQKPAAATIESLSQLTSFLEDNFDMEEVLFRGQRRDWPLLPKIARIRLQDGADVMAAEREMLTLLKSRALPFLEIRPESEWDWLSIAQHYGMATRLLDWTSNPLAALWFAVGRPAEDAQPGVLWIFTPRTEDYVQNPQEQSPFDGRGTRVFRPRHLTRRIVAQSGWFTVHKYMAVDKLLCL